MMGAKRWTQVAVCGGAGLLLAPGCNVRANASGWGSEASEFVDELPPRPASCGNGEVDPGEFCHELETQRIAGLDPCDITVRDFDGDGIDDVAVPNSIVPTDGWGLPCSGCEHVSNVMMALGDGDLGEAKPYSSGPLLPAGIASGDFDGDGRWDFITSNTYGEAVTMVRGQGDGSFEGDELVIDVGGFAGVIKAGDLDSDGFTDAVVAVDPGLAIVDGASWSVNEMGVGAPVVSLGLADLDLDGTVDLIAVTDGGTVNIQLGTGAGSFSSVAQIGGAGSMPGSVAAGDLDSDGDLDVLVVSPSQRGVMVLEQGSDGGFDFAQIVDVGSPQLHGIALADFNSDGVLDIAVSDLHYNDVYILIADGGDYPIFGAWKTGERPIALETGEFNGDGVPDIAVANQFANTVTLINSQP